MKFSLLKENLKKAPGCKHQGLFHLCSFFFLCCVSLLTFSCSKGISPDIEQRFAGKTMGTSYSIIFYYPESLGKTANAQTIVEIKKDVDARLEALENVMSTYRQDSALSQFNQSSVNEWHVLNPELFKVVKEALRISDLSEGAFDISVGPLVNLWGFGPEFTKQDLPEQSKINELLDKQVGYQFLELDEASLSARKTKALYLDLSAIAKGYAVDEVAGVLKQKGINNYLVEIGGELSASGGKPDGENWHVAVEKPILDVSASDRQLQSILKLRDVAIASSGDYRNFFEIDGKVYSHTINPKSGRPVEQNLASVTVVHEFCMTADAMATAFMVMGSEATLAFAEREHLPVLLLIRKDDSFEQLSSSAMEKYLEKQ